MEGRTKLGMLVALTSEISSSYPAMKWGPQPYNHKELNSANDLKILAVYSTLELSDKTPDWPTS